MDLRLFTTPPLLVELRSSLFFLPVLVSVEQTLAIAITRASKQSTSQLGVDLFRQWKFFSLMVLLATQQVTMVAPVKASSVHTASLHGHELVLRLLLSSGADPAACDTGGSQPIHDAAAGGHVGCMELLTHLGADPNASDCAGCTPLHRGSSAGEVDAARWLLKQKGVDANCRDNIGSTPLYWAASRGRADVVALLIREGNADPSAPNAHRSPLHVAAGWRHLSVCDELLKAGADPLAVDREGLTVLQVAKTDDVAKLLDEELVASRS
ncbi:ankyrin repeat, PH and SEC7 domain containing protein secG isoform X5 [Selaginella moellendorffii]|uniref:ankyrin repeat, PH and SEC7 domain containing protein secG isoform X5 n=1 Tax=Selaginella moellendorffii TaxID=88036 RepID=UPI000D1C7DC8|nr:ankyrin repeat, PH and SEC7 domain containing protein secG isoform X5 [Selaginella moellendorffii]XP_024525366.1 ankyrin repeat, PH and SEC7 domain containing protein secG isoform X5 [Selaginella moellendorffii]|eukprot:XP_024525357.1 ankyrin repeat, PH and SEC7 domain containing protein secG isoform X5 [Selaginella moellendorffii]